MRLPHVALLSIVVPLSLGAQPPTRWPINEAPPQLRTLVARADLVILTLHASVLSELDRTFAQGGPDVAIQTCHIDTTLTTYRFAREGIAAGRTSDRLRSPSNRAPKWAADTIRSYAGRQAKEVDGFAFDLGDRIGVLRPVAEREMCAHCHGAADQLTARVREVLADRYPADLAVGFREGDLRGWYWVEMPKPRSR